MRVSFPSPVWTISGAGRGKCVPALVGGVTLGASRWPTDPIGSHRLTLLNVVVGSRIHIEKQDDSSTQFYDAIADANTVLIVLPAYASGSPFNDLRIKVRKGSAQPKYLPFETFATAFVGSASVFVAQVPDTIAT